MPTVRELTDSFHDRWLATHPFAASLYGIPGHEGQVPDDSEAGEAAWRGEGIGNVPEEHMLAPLDRLLHKRGHRKAPLAGADPESLALLVDPRSARTQPLEIVAGRSLVHERRPRGGREQHRRAAERHG